jgi:hypothetical protein
MHTDPLAHQTTKPAAGSIKMVKNVFVWQKHLLESRHASGYVGSHRARFDGNQLS